MITQPTPWWGTLVLAAIGFIGTLAVTMWSSARDKKRADAERAERALDKRATVYAEYYRAATAVRMSLGGERLPAVDLSDVKRAGNDYTHARAVVLLAAPRHVRAAVAEVDARMEEVGQARARNEPDREAYPRAIAHMAGAVANVLALMQSDVGNSS